MEIPPELESTPTGHWYASVVHKHQKVAANALQLSSNKSQQIFFFDKKMKGVANLIEKVKPSPKRESTALMCYCVPFEQHKLHLKYHHALQNSLQAKFQDRECKTIALLTIIFHDGDVI